MSAERLQKILAHAGIASRRAAEALILEGRVRVNGRIVSELGAKANPQKDKIEVDGKRIVNERLAYYLLHKPRATMTTLSDPEGRATIKTLMRGIPERVFPVGRLDFHTTGALLLTNDGDLADALMRPKSKVPKVYLAKIKGTLDEKALERLRNGLVLDDDYKTAPADVIVTREEGDNSWAQITLYEGKNRQIHRMAAAVGARVQRLARVSFAGIDVSGLAPGEYRELSEKEVAALKKKHGVTTGRRDKSPKSQAR